MKFMRMALIVAVILFATSTLTRRAESQAPNEGGTRTKVVLLGTGTPIPDPDGSGPATAIVVGDSAYLVDSDPALYVEQRPLLSTGKFRQSNLAI